MMSTDARTAVSVLRTCWRDASSGADGRYKDIQGLFSALRDGRFGFRFEPWHRPDGPGTSEMLLRAWDERGLAVSHGTALDLIFRNRLCPAFDQYLALLALQAVGAGEEPVSINILGSSLAAGRFWTLLSSSCDHDPGRVVFEILEHEDVPIVNQARMRRAREKGYRFALDDFSNTPGCWRRLAMYREHISYVKLDGPFVRAGLEGDSGFFAFLRRMNRDYPGIQLVAEHVRNSTEAVRLFGAGVAAVQGRNLPEAGLRYVAGRTPSSSFP